VCVNVHDGIGGHQSIGKLEWSSPCARKKTWWNERTIPGNCLSLPF